MNPISFTTIRAGITILLAAQAYALEAPTDDAPPPPMAEMAANPADAKLEAKADAAYLGVVSSVIPEMLTAHLPLKEGQGIIVRALMPDGPAAKAGIAIHDIITHVAGQAIGSPQAFSREVSAHKPGETIRLDLIHEGKATVTDVTLGARPAELAGIEGRPLDQLNLEGIPEELANRLRAMIEGNLGQLEMQMGEDPKLEEAPQLDEAMREMKKRMEKAMKGMDAQGLPHQGKIEIQQGATIKMLDKEGSIELKSNNGGKEVTIRDKDNQITWTGPWDTAQDKAAAPADVRQRVESLHLDTTVEGNVLRLHMNPKGEPNDGP